jgi:hypothetical protein
MKRRGLWLSLGAIALVLLVGRALAGIYAEYRWYAAVGAQDVWDLRLASETLLRALALSVAGAIGFANFWGVRHSVVSLVLPRRLANIEIGEEVPARVLMVIVIAMSVVFGVAFALPAWDWQGFELAQYGLRFNEADPYLNSDVGFYVYWLPFERSMYAWFAGVIAGAGAIVVGLYALTPSLRWESGRIHVSTYVRRHIALLGGAIIALLAWSFRLDIYAPLTQGSGPDGAFGAFDHQLGVPIAMIMAYAAIGAAFVVAWSGWTGQSRVALTVMAVLLLLTPTMQYALPLVVRWASAPVNPEIRERPFAGDRIGYTRRAFGVDRITPLSAAEALRSVRDAAGISVWDPLALTRAIERTQRRGRILGSPSLALSPAGPVFQSVEYGRDDVSPGRWTLVRTLAAVTDERGSPARVDAQGRFPLEDQQLGPVLIYEGAVGPLVVTDTLHAIAAPMMESFGARLAEAWSQQNFRLLASPTKGARMVRRRDVRERVRAITPFFVQSTTIVPIVHGDSLLWAVELYSASSDYPLARRFAIGDRDVSYLRHAGTALVHPYSGRVTIIPDADPDPIAQTWMRLLPRTLGRTDRVPPSLRALLPPDVDGAELQARAFAVAGMRLDAASSGRHLATSDGSDSLVWAHAPTLVWWPPVGASVWIAPVIDAQDHVSGVLVSTGGARRGVRWFASREPLVSWGVLLDRLQRSASEPESGPRDMRVAGRVRLLPLGDGALVALQPFYGWPADGAPYVSHVSIATSDTSRVAPSVAAAVGAPAASGPAPATPGAREERLRVLYAEMQAALQHGDWRRFGAAFDALGALLERR